MEYLPFNKLFLEDLKYYPYPKCPECGDKLIFYKENNKYGLYCRSECHEYNDRYETIPVMIREWNDHCHRHLRVHVVDWIAKFAFLMLFIYAILIFKGVSPLIFLVLMASIGLMVFVDYFASIYMKYQINKHKRYIESLDEDIKKHSGGGFATYSGIRNISSNEKLKIPTNIEQLNQLRKQLSKVDGDTSELVQLCDKLETLIKLKD